MLSVGIADFVTVPVGFGGLVLVGVFVAVFVEDVDVLAHFCEIQTSTFRVSGPHTSAHSPALTPSQKHPTFSPHSYCAAYKARQSYAHTGKAVGPKARMSARADRRWVSARNAIAVGVRRIIGGRWTLRMIWGVEDERRVQRGRDERS